LHHAKQPETQAAYRFNWF